MDTTTRSQNENSTEATVNGIFRAFLSFTGIVLFTTVASWYIYLRTGDFLLRPVFAVTDFMGDLRHYAPKMSDVSHGAAQIGNGYPIYNYPAPAIYLYHFLMFSIPGHRCILYVLIVGVMIAGFTALIWPRFCGPVKLTSSAKLAVLAIAVLGFPMLYGLYIGNLEPIVWGVGAAGLCCILTGRFTVGAILVGIAGSVKPFPLIDLLLLLRFRRYRDIGVGIATTAILVLSALAALGPTPWQAYKDLKPGIALYMQDYMQVPRPIDEQRALHSPLDAMKVAAMVIEIGHSNIRTATLDHETIVAIRGGWKVTKTLANIYPPIMALMGIALFVKFYRAPLLNQLIALGAAAALLPPGGEEYTLLELYIPLGALMIFLTCDVASGKTQVQPTAIYALMATYALLLAPLSLLSLYEGCAKLLLVLFLIYLSAKYPMRSAYFESLTKVKPYS